MSVSPGTHTLTPADGTIRIHTYREGIAQRVGHDLIIDVGEWQASVDVDGDGAPTAISLDIDSTSLQIRDGLHGVKPLTDGDRADIRKRIDEKILRRQPITFRSAGIEESGQQLTVQGQLSIAGSSRDASFPVELSPDGRLDATLTVAQSDHGITPYRGLMGALKVRDDVEIVIDVRLPTG